MMKKSLNISDELPSTIARSKRPLSAVLSDVPAVESSYNPLRIAEREAVANLPDKNASPTDVFRLFVTNQHLDLITCNTNANARLQQVDPSVWKDEYEYDYEGPRRRKPTVAAEIGTFLGVLLYMGETKAANTAEYWKLQEDKAFFLIVRAMSLKRFEQIKRYLKVSDPLTEPDPKYSTWYAKIEPLYSDFCSTSQRLLIPGRNVSVDEQLIQFKGRSRHSMKMAVKKAKKGFKIYSLCWTSYIITFLWTSKATKISNLERTKGLSESSSVVVLLTGRSTELIDWTTECRMDRSLN